MKKLTREKPLTKKPTKKQEIPAYAKCGFTEEQFKRFHTACHSTFWAVLPDCLSCDESAYLEQDEVIQTVCDADYLARYGGMSKEHTAEFEAVISKHYDTPAFNQMMKSIFPFKRYGI